MAPVRKVQNFKGRQNSGGKEGGRTYSKGRGKIPLGEVEVLVCVRKREKEDLSGKTEDIGGKGRERTLGPAGFEAIRLPSLLNRLILPKDGEPDLSTPPGYSLSCVRTASRYPPAQ